MAKKKVKGTAVYHKLGYDKIGRLGIRLIGSLPGIHLLLNATGLQYLSPKPETLM